MTLSSEEQTPSPQIPSCSFCAGPASAWLALAHLEIGPDDTYHNFWERCSNVLSAGMIRLTKDTDRWCFVDLAWLLPPMTDEELLGWNSAGGVA